MKLSPILGLATLLGMIHPAGADLLEPVEGGRMRLPATIDGDRVLLDTPDGVVAFPRSDFRAIVAEPYPSRDWPARKAQALARGTSERLNAAMWALDHGLIPEAEAMLRLAHQDDPTNEPAKRLVKLLDRLATPLPDPDLSPLRLHLPKTMTISRGPHVLLLHQHSEAEAAERIDVLERVLKAYYLTFAAIGFDLPPPTRRLPSAWLASKTDYLAYLRAEGAEAFLTTRGYRHPSRGLVVAYDCRSDPVFLARYPRLGVASSGENDRKLAREQIRMELDRREIDLAVASHETVHQLVDVSRLSPRPEAFPHWFSEGLAMQFEAIEAGRWAGLGTPSTLRLADYARIHPPPRLVPTVRDAGFGHGYRQDLYAQAWALTYHLRVDHPRMFVAYLDALRVPNAAEASVEAGPEPAFATAMATPLGEFESQWHQAMKSLEVSHVAAPRPRPGP